MRCLTALTGVVALLLICGAAAAQQNQPDMSKFVSREEYDKLLKSMQEMRAEMDALKKERAAPAPAAPAQPPGQAMATQADVDQAMDDVDKRLRAIQKQTELLAPGKTNIFIAGDAFFGFNALRHSPSSFEAGVSPLVLWKLSDRLLIEAAADIGVATDDTGASSTSFDLTIGNASYMFDPALIVGAGLFVVPFGVFHNHYDPPWINKLPDSPLPFGDSGIAPGSEVGAFLVGAHPIGPTKINYAFYVTNGPQVNTTDPAAAGSLNFNDYTDLNSNKAVGGRLGFLPLPEMEFGYSIMSAEVQPQDFRRVEALLQAVDFSYKKPVDFFSGTIDFRTEWVWSHVQNVTYDANHKLGFGPLSYGNNRDGGYVQVAYRPTMFSNKIIRNLEPVVRWDRLDVPTRAPGGGFEERWTVGLDYWVMPNAVFKVAYQFDSKQIGQSDDALMIQFGVGL
ncbi:MAG: hypothetical protein ACHRHE_07990 [Tepidisphaerales bacterium]